MKCTIDIETDNIDPLAVTKIWCIVCKDIETGKVYTWASDGTINYPHESTVHDYEDLYWDFGIFAEHVDMWWGHNLVTYDIPILNRLLGTEIKLSQLRDTLVLSRLFNSHWRDKDGKVKAKRQRHSLAAWGEFFNFPKDTFDDFTQYSAELLSRCVDDVEITDMTRKYLSVEGKAFSKGSIEVEHWMAHILNKQKQGGFYFDVPSAQSLLATCREETDTIESSFQEAFPPIISEEIFIPKVNRVGLGYRKGVPTVRRREIPFNAGSPKQRAQRNATASTSTSVPIFKAA